MIRNGETCKKMGCPFPAFIAKYWRMQSTSRNKPLLALLRTCVGEVECGWFKFLSEATCECLLTPLHQKHTTSSLLVTTDSMLSTLGVISLVGRPDKGIPPRRAASHPSVTRPFNFRPPLLAFLSPCLPLPRQVALMRFGSGERASE